MTTTAAGKSGMSRLARTAPDTLRCSCCSTELAFASQIVSKGFTGRYGRAYLVAPPAPPAEQDLANVRVGRNENRQLVTGWHVVADISCTMCSSKLGWKYVDAKEPSQKYKVGKFILETERVMTHRQWGDVLVETVDLSLEDEKDDRHRRFRDDDAEEQQEEDDNDEIEFDSGNDDECEDIFAGTWDAETVARRRSSVGVRRKSQPE
jgi:hypothetical protein